MFISVMGGGKKVVRKEVGRLLPELCVPRSTPGEDCGTNWLGMGHRLNAPNYHNLKKKKKASSKLVFLPYLSPPFA